VKKNCSARVISSASVSMNGSRTSARSSREALARLGRLGLLGRQVERALDVVGQLVAAERLVAGEQELVVAQHVEVRDVRADVDQRDFWSRPLAGSDGAMSRNASCVA